MTTLKITDGTTTIDFIYHSSTNPNYMLTRDEWTPSVARLRVGVLAGDSQYDPVVEEIGVRVMGATAAAALANLSAIAALLDQADRWSRGAPVAAVKIKYAPTGSTVSSSTPLEAVILGRAEGDESNPVGLAPNFNSQIRAYVLDVQLRFTRRGVWCAVAESANVTSVTNPGIMTVTMPSAPPFPNGTAVTVSGFSTAAVTGAIDIPPAYIMLAPQIDLQQAESPFSSTLAASASYTSTADATARASGGNIGRLDHSAAALSDESVLTFIPSLGNTANLRHVAVYCTYRNNTPSAWTLRVSGGKGLTAAASLVQTYAPIVRIAAASSNPTVLYVGTVSSQYGLDYISLNIACTAKAGAVTLDLDTVVFVDRSTNEAYVVAINGARATLGASVASQSASVIIDNQTALLTPSVTISLAGGQTIPQSYNGPAALTSKAGTLKVLWYATHLYGGSSAYWATQDVTGSASLALNVAIGRQPGYITPV